jgi:hypothetical protein
LKLTKILFLFIVLAFAGCSKEPKKKDFIARVNDSYLTREEFASLVDTTKLTPIDRERIIKDWLYLELLYQKAKDKKITEQDEFKNILKTSTRELAAALLMNDYLSSEEIKYSDSDLEIYFGKNKNSFQLSIESYLMNKVIFKTENEAIKFRSVAVESDWTKATNSFSNDSSLIINRSSELIKENDLYPFQLMKIAKDLFPQEISIVIPENNDNYSVIQMLGKYEKGTIPNFEVIKQRVADRFIAEKKKQLIDDYLKELYSNNDIEIKK